MRNARDEPLRHSSLIAQHSLLVSGFGRVGRAFAALVAERGEELRVRYGLEVVIGGATDGGGGAVAPGGAGLPLDALAAHQGGLATFPEFGRPGCGTLDALAGGEWRALIETTPTDLATGGAARAHIEAALAGGVDVVTATKGPLALDYAGLRDLARRSGARLRCGAAVAAALPTLDVAEVALAGARIASFAGVLNGTTNYILDRMAATGRPYEEALVEAQARGIAEPDPSLDVEGRDTAAKLVILANALSDVGLRLADVAVTGITGVTPDEVVAARAAGGGLRLVGRCRWEGGRAVATVRPERLAADDPLAHVAGAEKAIVYQTDTMDRIVVAGGKSDPRGAAAALLRDVINLYRADR